MTYFFIHRYLTQQTVSINIPTQRDGGLKSGNSQKKLDFNENVLRYLRRDQLKMSHLRSGFLSKLEEKRVRSFKCWREK